MVLDTNTLTVTVNDLDFYPIELVTSFSSDQIKYHLHYAAEYHPDRLRRLVNNGMILNYLLDLEIAVDEALERQVNKWKANDREYLAAVAAGDMDKANGLENMLRLCAREPIFAAMVYVLSPTQKDNHFTIDEFPHYSAEVRGFCCLQGAC